MDEYGFKKVLSMDDYASYFDNIDPLDPYNMAPNDNITSNLSSPRYDVSSERVQAAFVVSDPVDWSRDITVFILFLCISIICIIFTVLHVCFYFFHFCLC
ncbi:hypothetical protein MKX01_021831 [Papaver californicum]|nr:hypothetical protein MKX01_021831 [Papaver californicum]